MNNGKSFMIKKSFWIKKDFSNGIGNSYEECVRENAII